MSTLDDHGLEVLRKAGELVTPGDRSNTYIKVGPTPGHPLEVVLLDSEPGDPFFYESIDDTDPGTEKTLISDTVSVTERFLSQMIVSCRIESVFTLKVDGAIKGRARTSAAQPNDSFLWNPRFSVLSGSTIEITVKARTGSPITDCEAFLHCLDNS
jgi:hypothetical protein